MPKPSEFVIALRKRGIHSGELSYRNRPKFDPAIDIFHLPKKGKKISALLEETASLSNQSKLLLTASQPVSKSTLTASQIKCSSFVRIGARAMNDYYRKANNPLLAIIHVEYALVCPVDYNPYRLSRSKSTSDNLILTVRLLDLHSQTQGASQQSGIIKALAWSLSDQLFEHLQGPLGALRDMNDDDLIYGQHLLIRIQAGDQSQLLTAISNQLETNIRYEFNDSMTYEDVEVFDQAENIDILHTSPDKEFFDAIMQGITSRKNDDKPPRVRAEPNSLHHVLVRDDPYLRYRNGKVLHLWRLARMQITASDNRITEELEAEGIDWLETDAEMWGPSIEDRLEKMTGNPDLEKISWVFVIDDGTHVFSATPVKSNELTIDRLNEILEESWLGENGLLRGPPKQLAIPVAYLDGTQREKTVSLLSLRGVELTQPQSGFAAPIHIVKHWCEASCNFEKASHRSTPIKPPCVTSFAYLQNWTFAHMLSEFAASAYNDDANIRQRIAFSGGGYGHMTTIKVKEYAKAMNLGEPLEIFKSLKAKCHNDFTNLFAY